MLKGSCMYKLCTHWTVGWFTPTVEIVTQWQWFELRICTLSSLATANASVSPSTESWSDPTGRRVDHLEEQLCSINNAIIQPLPCQHYLLIFMSQSDSMNFYPAWWCVLFVIIWKNAYCGWRIVADLSYSHLLCLLSCNRQFMPLLRLLNMGG